MSSPQCQQPCAVFYKKREICSSDPCVSIGLNCQKYGASNSTVDCQAWCCVADTQTLAVFIVVVIIIVLCIVFCIGLCIYRFYLTPRAKEPEEKDPADEYKLGDDLVNGKQRKKKRDPFSTPSQSSHGKEKTISGDNQTGVAVEEESDPLFEQTSENDNNEASMYEMQEQQQAAQHGRRFSSKGGHGDIGFNNFGARYANDDLHHAAAPQGARKETKVAKAYNHWEDESSNNSSRPMSRVPPPAPGDSYGAGKRSSGQAAAGGYPPEQMMMSRDPVPQPPKGGAAGLWTEGGHPFAQEDDF